MWTSHRALFTIRKISCSKLRGDMPLRLGVNISLARLKSLSTMLEVGSIQVKFITWVAGFTWASSWLSAQDFFAGGGRSAFWDLNIPFRHFGLVSCHRSNATNWALLVQNIICKYLWTVVMPFSSAAGLLWLLPINWETLTQFIQLHVGAAWI